MLLMNKFEHIKKLNEFLVKNHDKKVSINVKKYPKK